MHHENEAECKYQKFKCNLNPNKRELLKYQKKAHNNHWKLVWIFNYLFMFFFHERHLEITA